ncbi:C40 family peptidase [Candidatus Saccharibacteria bacterium]|nr:C40 family peptidase [Candidatus Saccharibacteria bacterium]
MIDYNKYVGLPWAEKGVSWNGVNCWGLIRLFYEYELKIILPDYHNEYEKAVSKNTCKILRREADKNFIKVSRAQPHDVILFREGLLPQHVALVINNSRMLNINKDQTSTIERYTDSEWKNNLVSFYRFKNLA